jgi:sporulation related protein
MKLAFLLFVLINLLLYAWQQGVFGRYVETGREPERLARQVEPERIRVLTEREVQKLRERAAPTSGAIDLNLAQACVEFGDFGPTDAARAEKALAALATVKQSPRTVETAGWYQVLVPPHKTRVEADRHADELRKSGIKDVQVIADNGPNRFGLSLGVFRDPDGARAHVAALEKLGVKGARVAEKPTSVSAVRYQLRDLDVAAARQLAALRSDFPSQSVRACNGTG